MLKMKTKKMPFIIGVGAGFLSCCIVLLFVFGWKSSHQSIETYDTTSSKNQYHSVDPFWGSIGQGGFTDLQAYFDDLMNDMSINANMLSNRSFGVSMTAPSIKMNEKLDRYEIVLEMPEGQEVELNTELSEGVLAINGKLRNTFEANSSNQISRSYQESQFSKSITFPDLVDEDNMQVEQKENVITIIIPKA